MRGTSKGLGKRMVLANREAHAGRLGKRVTLGNRAAQTEALGKRAVVTYDVTADIMSHSWIKL